MLLVRCGSVEKVNLYSRNKLRSDRTQVWIIHLKPHINRTCKKWKLSFIQTLTLYGTKTAPEPKWKSALVTALTCLLFLVTKGRASWFIICTDGFHTLTEASNLTSFQTQIPCDFLFPHRAELPFWGLAALFTVLKCFQWILTWQVAQHIQACPKKIVKFVWNLSGDVIQSLKDSLLLFVESLNTCNKLGVAVRNEVLCDPVLCKMTSHLKWCLSCY